MITNNRFDFIIVGAGIAGMAIAEILQRSGYSVALIEQEDRIGKHASSYQAGWFHTGDLYAMLPTHRYTIRLRENLSSLLSYYAGFEGMNLAIEGEKITTREVHHKWFDSNTLRFYYVSPFSNKASLRNKLLWFFMLLKIRYDSWFSPRLHRSGTPSFLEESSYSIIYTLDGYDRRMNTFTILVDLLRSFLGHGGKLWLRAPVLSVKKGKVFLSSGKEIYGEHVVVAAGRQINDLTNVYAKTVYSPIAVLYPALTTRNFAIMTPDIQRTINHIYHPLAQGKGYSVVGNATYFPEVTVQVFSDAKKIFSDILQGIFKNVPAFKVYFGHKTEVVFYNQLRNYQSHIIERDCCTVVVPGKFTFAFSLAVDVCKKFNIEPTREIDSLLSIDEVAPLVSYPRHFYIAQDLIGA